MAKLKDGFYKQTAESIGSDSYVLLAGGGSKLVSDFATASSLSNYYTKTDSDDRYFRTRDTIDTVDANGNAISNYIDTTDYTADNTLFQKLKNGTYLIKRKGHSEILVSFYAGGSASSLELKTNYVNTDRVYVRKTVDSKRISGEWKA